MSQKQWSAVDEYFDDMLVKQDSLFDKVLAANIAGGLPAYDVSPSQGKFLYLLALIKGARSILEIGTLGAYSTIWLARALPEDGRLVSLEANPKHAEVARANVVLAGMENKVDIRTGKALDILPQLAAAKTDPFDFIFIDADKPSNPEYLAWALKLSKPGTVIIGDNVVRSGAVTDPNSADENVNGVRKFIEMQSVNLRLEATALQTVGSKGYDGFSIAVVKAA